MKAPHAFFPFMFAVTMLQSTAQAAAPTVAWSAKLDTNIVFALAFAPDGAQLASGSLDGMIRVWDARTGAAAGTLTNEGTGLLNLWFQSDGTLLSWDQAARLKGWRLSDSSVINHLSLPPEYAGGWGAYSGAGNLFAAVSAPYLTRGRPSVWRLGDAIPMFEGPYADTSSFSPDGKELAAGLDIKEAYRIELYRTTDWTLRLTLTNRLGQAIGGPLLYSRDGSLLVVPGIGFLTTEIWRLPSGESYGYIRDETNGWDRRFLFTPDGRLILTTANRSLIRFWSVRPGANERPLFVYDQGVSEVATMAISPNGGLIALGKEDGAVMVIRTPVFITQTTLVGDQFVIEWAGGSETCQVQQRLSLTSGVWENVGEPTTARSLALPRSGSAMFYRVVSLPE